MAYIYLGFKEGTYNSEESGGFNVEIKVTKEPYYKCSTFEVRTYNIKYPGSQGSSQVIKSECYLYIRTGSRKQVLSEDKYYYWPSNNDQVVQHVESYYNILDDRLPFALVFTTRGGIKKFCRYDDLNNKGDPRQLPGTIIKNSNLCEYLIGSSGSKCKIFQIKPGSENNINVVQREHNIGEYFGFKKVVFTPNSSILDYQNLPLCIGNLFTLEPKNALENGNSHSFPETVTNETFDAVRVYYNCSEDDSGFLPILIELVNDCKTTHIKRTGKKPPKWTEEEVRYGNDDELVDQLNIIKRVLEGAIIYELHKNENDHSYSRDSVSVISAEKHDFGYNIYTHEPVDLNGEKAPLPSYKGKGIEPLNNPGIPENSRRRESEEDTLNKISTYALSDKAKEHLLIKLTKDDGATYLHRFNKDGTKWRRLSLEELKQAGIDISTESVMDLNRKLDQLLDEKTHSENVKLLLEYISFSVNSVVVLLDNKLPYDRQHIELLIQNEIPPIDINNSIDPKEYTEPALNCLTSSGFKVYKHHLNKAVESVRTNLGITNLYLRFYLGSNYITLYDPTPPAPSYLRYSDQNDLYVFYYGGTDPRPLLLCHDGNAYRPKDLDSYSSQWFKDHDIKSCLCQGNDKKYLLNALYRVVGFLNVVQLEKTTIMLNEIQNLGTEEPEDEGRSAQYPLQTFNSNTVYIKVSHKNKKCYRIYIYEHNGDSNNGISYTLGDVKYNLDCLEPNGLEYKSSDPLLTVSAYYHVHDQGHEYPFLVVLEFKVNTGSTYEYYKLKEKGKKVWIKMEERFDKDILKKLKSVENIEDGLHDLRTELGIEFKDKNIIPLFKDNECKEEKINIAAIAGGTVGTAAVVGTGVTIGVVVSKNLAAGAAAAAATTIAL